MTPPIPEGFVPLEQPGQGVPPVPEGFVPLESVAPRSAVDQLTGATGPRYQLWPERLARGIGEAIHSGATFAGDVVEGKADPFDVKRAVDMATLGMPLNPAYAAGSRFGARPIPRQPSPGETAAVISAELGAPLPRGVATDSRAMQAVTQAARQMPFAGQRIEEVTGNTIAAAGAGVTGLAERMGATNRAELGSNMRTAINDLVQKNKGEIDAAYTDVRSVIDPKAVFIPQNTKAALDRIVASRLEARQPNPTSGLEQIQKMAEEGISFDGLIRAKSDLAQSTDFLGVHAGFSTGDKKMLGAAMKRDLHLIAGQSGQGPTGAAAALTLLTGAERKAQELIVKNKALNRIAGAGTDEGIANRLLASAGDKSGNIQLLRNLKAMPKEDFEQISGTLLADLGNNPATGVFSLDKFYTNWSKLSSEARSMLYPGQHGKFLDDIATLGKHLKNAEQYRNTSGTGRAWALGTMVGSGGTALVAAAMGNYAPLLGLGASVAGGYALASGLSRPAVAASMARLAREAMKFEKAPSPATRATLLLAARDATNNLASVNNVSPAEFLRLLQGPVKATGGNE